MSDTYRLGAREFRSRLIIGTGKYKSFEENRFALDASGAEMITVAVRRVDLSRRDQGSLLDHIPPEQFAIAPHLVFYLKIDEKTLIRRVLQARGMDYWESGMDMKLGDDIYESFRAYQKALLKEYASMSEEFNFRVLDARRKVEVIQDELRRQIGAFLAESDSTRTEAKAEVTG